MGEDARRRDRDAPPGGRFVVVEAVDAPRHRGDQLEHLIGADGVDGIADGLIEILADDSTRGLKSKLSEPAEEYYPWLDEMLGSFVP